MGNKWFVIEQLDSKINEWKRLFGYEDELAALRIYRTLQESYPENRYRVQSYSVVDYEITVVNKYSFDYDGGVSI